MPDLGLPAGRQARVPVRVLVDGRVSEVVELTIGLPPPPEPAPTPTPEPMPSPELPSPEPKVAPTAAPSPAPKPTPSVTAAPAPGKALTEADAAVEAREFERAVLLYEQALKADPTNGKAKAGLEAARAAAAALARAFVLGKTQVEGAPARGENIKAFDTRDVAVKKPVEVSGRVDIEATPNRVKTGDPVRIKVWLQNEGGKPIKLSALNVATTIDTVRTSGPVGPGRPRSPAEAAGPRGRDRRDLEARVGDLAHGGPDHLRQGRDVHEPPFLEVGPRAPSSRPNSSPLHLLESPDPSFFEPQGGRRAS